MDKVDVENVLRPGTTRKVNATKYREMCAAYLSVLPDRSPGLTPSELLARLSPRLDPLRFPDTATAGWWAKTVQLDLEAKGIAARAPKGPVRLWSNERS